LLLVSSGIAGLLYRKKNKAVLNTTTFDRITSFPFYTDCAVFLIIEEKTNNATAMTWSGEMKVCSPNQRENSMESPDPVQVIIRQGKSLMMKKKIMPSSQRS
jgi:hypothetical protein